MKNCTIITATCHWGLKLNKAVQIRCASKIATSSSLPFDTRLKIRQRDWSYAITDSAYYDYIRTECAERLVDRIDDITRTFPLALDFGCHRGHILNVLKRANSEREGEVVGGIRSIIQCDISNRFIEEAKAKASVSDESCESSSDVIRSHAMFCELESLPFGDNSFDIVLSSMYLHWVNDLPAVLQNIKRILKPDGAFVGAMLGGTTLQELKYCLYLAEQERRGGFSPHVSPFVLASDIAGLMQAAGFALPTVDIDTLTIGYPDAICLMEHVVKMGEGNASLNREYSASPETLIAAAALYQELYGRTDGSVHATFQLVYMIGWSPDASQPKPCQRGSAIKSLKDLESTTIT